MIKQGNCEVSDQVPHFCFWLPLPALRLHTHTLRATSKKFSVPRVLKQVLKTRLQQGSIRKRRAPWADCKLASRRCVQKSHSLGGGPHVSAQGDGSTRDSVWPCFKTLSFPMTLRGSSLAKTLLVVLWRKPRIIFNDFAFK